MSRNQAVVDRKKLKDTRAWNCGLRGIGASWKHSRGNEVGRQWPYSAGQNPQNKVDDCSYVSLTVSSLPKWLPDLGFSKATPKKHLLATTFLSARGHLPC